MTRRTSPSHRAAGLAFVVTVSSLLVGCGDGDPSGSPPASPQPADIEREPLIAAMERIPFADSGYPGVEGFPEQVLLDHLACVKDVAGDNPPAIYQLRDDMATKAAYADCAEAAGVGAYADVWHPPTEEEQRRDYAEFDEMVRECLTEAGYEDLPTASFPLGTGIDTDAVIAQDPGALAVLEDCFAEEDHPEDG